MMNKITTLVTVALTLSFISLSSCQHARHSDRSPAATSSSPFGQINYNIPGESQKTEFHISNESGFLKKVDLIDRAREGTTLDLAYFIYDTDYSSSYLTSKLIHKAKNGVKVRLIVDYFMTEKQKDWFAYMVAAGEKDSRNEYNIQVRRFRPANEEFKKYLRETLEMSNPDAFVQGIAASNSTELMKGISSSPKLVRIAAKAQKEKASLAKLKMMSGPEAEQAKMGMLIKFLSDEELMRDVTGTNEFPAKFKHFLRRMHHKLLVASTANGGELREEFIVGGRNISDEYHLSYGHKLMEGRKYPFVDSEISGVFSPKNQGGTLRASFETMWNAGKEIVEPVIALDTQNPQQRMVYANYDKQMRDKVKELEGYMPDLKDRAEKGTIRSFTGQPLAIDYLENFFRSGMDEKEITEMWVKLIKQAKHDIVIISAYFYLFPEVIQPMAEALARGVKIKIYTNSYFSTDLNLVNLSTYALYDQWIKQLNLVDPPAPENFQIFELGYNAGGLKPGEGSLHVKMINVDNEILGVGSCNFDNRNQRLDSNNMIFVNDPKVAEEVSGAYLANYHNFTYREDLIWNRMTRELAQKFVEETNKKSPWMFEAIKLGYINENI